MQGEAEPAAEGRERGGRKLDEENGSAIHTLRAYSNYYYYYYYYITYTPSFSDVDNMGLVFSPPSESPSLFPHHLIKEAEHCDGGD